MSDVLKFKDRKFVSVLYPEDPTHVLAMEKLQAGGYDFAAILHDKDLYETDGEDHKKGDLNCENFCWYPPLSQQCQDPDILPG